MNNIKKIPVIIDCDPGHDDAIMLMLAFGSGRFEVKAVSTSAGNQTQDKTLRNALKLLTLIGVDVPVFRGCEKPMLRELIIADHVHGETGLHGAELPAPVITARKPGAAQGIAEILTESKDKITIVATGPLTNIATLLLAYPHLKEKIECISIMGGGIFRGNMTPLAEFNIYVDPEAAQIVFRAGVPIKMCGLDVTHKALFFEEDIQKLRSIGNRCGFAAANLMDFYSTFYIENRTELDGGAALHDPCAIAMLIDPTIFQTKLCYVDVETTGRLTSGTTVVDFYDVMGQQPNAEVAYDIDNVRYKTMIYDAIGQLS